MLKSIINNKMHHQREITPSTGDLFTFCLSQGAAFGFSTIAAQAGEQLAPYMSQIVPRLYRYTFDPNVKIQTAMRSIWNAVVTDTKSTVRS